MKLSLSDPVELDNWISALAVACHGSKGRELQFYLDWMGVLESELYYHADHTD